MRTFMKLPLLTLGISVALAAASRLSRAEPPASEAAPSAAPSATAAFVAPPLDPEALRYGKYDYDRWCIWCHGPDGDGRGVSAKNFDPRPRDLTEGQYKCRSTATGTLPTDEDIKRMIRTGVHGAAMPAWASIGDQQLNDLVVWVKHYSDRFSTEPVPPPLVVPPEPASDAASVARGAAIYKKLGCIACHGPSLHGNGRSAHSLKDDDGFPISPADLTQPGSLKCGDTPARIYTTFMTGLNGTPMPSFADSLTPADAWDLVHFIKSLER